MADAASIARGRVQAARGLGAAWRRGADVSPACASLDMFEQLRAPRAQAFVAAVQALADGCRGHGTEGLAWRCGRSLAGLA
jgi:UDP-N-acetylmuramoylalanine-D-glutamate ligase